MSDEATKVPDIPCPKCGGEDVRILYQEQGWSVGMHEHKMCDGAIPSHFNDVRLYHALDEHFHRHCQRCHYAWATADVLAR